MSKKQKKRKKIKREKERYEIEIEDWEVYYHFGVNIGRSDYIPGNFWEISSITLWGKIVSPILKTASKAKLEISAKPDLDDHWKESPTEKLPSGVGLMEIPRGHDTLHLYCWIPSRSFIYIPVAASSGRIRHVSVYGEKLKWRRGRIFYISVTTNREEE
jgi:hypothetical protein